MSEMVDRVAGALVEQMPSLGSPSAPMVVSLARAAIAAMRKPTGDMWDEGFYEACGYIWQYDGDGAGFDKDGVGPVWQKMIDEALK